MRHDEDPRPAFKLAPKPNSVEGGKPGLPEPGRDSNQGPPKTLCPDSRQLLQCLLLPRPGALRLLGDILCLGLNNELP